MKAKQSSNCNSIKTSQLFKQASNQNKPQTKTNPQTSQANTKAKQAQVKQALYAKKNS